MQTVLDGVDVGESALARIAYDQRMRDARGRFAERDHRKRTDGVALWHSAVGDLWQHVPAGSVDVIWTDPPYARKYLYHWGELAAFAAHALKDGGSLLVLGGQPHLQQIMGLMDVDGLNWQWLLTYKLAGSRPQVFHRRVNVNTKPILWFVKGQYDGPFQSDVIAAPPPECGMKDHHAWGQSTVGILAVLARFASPGDVVCDPFVGGGTTAVAARIRGCDFIGADIDEACIATTRERLGEI